MERNQILREILSDPEITEKYNIKKSELDSLTTSPPYYKKIVDKKNVKIFFI